MYLFHIFESKNKRFRGNLWRLLKPSNATTCNSYKRGIKVTVSFEVKYLKQNSCWYGTTPLLYWVLIVSYLKYPLRFRCSYLRRAHLHLFWYEIWIEISDNLRLLSSLFRLDKLDLQARPAYCVCLKGQCNECRLLFNDLKFCAMQRIFYLLNVPYVRDVQYFFCRLQVMSWWTLSKCAITLQQCGQ